MGEITIKQIQEMKRLMEEASEPAPEVIICMACEKPLRWCKCVEVTLPQRGDNVGLR